MASIPDFVRAAAKTYAAAGVTASAAEALTGLVGALRPVGISRPAPAALAWLETGTNRRPMV